MTKHEVPTIQDHKASIKGTRKVLDCNHNSEYSEDAGNHNDIMTCGRLRYSNKAKEHVATLGRKDQLRLYLLQIRIRIEPRKGLTKATVLLKADSPINVPEQP